jgi:uncharacterized protein YjbI with pentapeptide repeats/beta-lactamase regulating signal transducer with metallopeptidase domain
MHGLIPHLAPVARVTVAVLFNSLWEAALLALAVWAILRILPNLNATTRYAAWCVALAGSLLLPIATALPQITIQHPSNASPALMSAHAPAPATTKHRSSTAIANVALAPAKTTASPSVSTFRVPERLRFSLPEYVALALFGAWVVAAIVLLIRLAVNLWRLETLKRDALPLPVEYRERLSQWAIAEKGEREVRLCVCDQIEVPVAVGLFDSMILIPQHLLDTLSPDEIDQIMLHELGHLRRADDWTNGVQRFIQALFFFNPAILYVAQQLDLEREVACDDWVLHQTKSVRPYATCLTKMAEVTAWPHRALAAPGVFVTRRGLSVRVERLLRAGRNVRTSIAFGPAGAVVAALVVMFFVLQSVAPSFAFTVPLAASTPAPLAKASRTPPRERIVYKYKKSYAKESRAVARVIAAVTPAPVPTPVDIVIPAIHVHTRASTVHVPSVNIDMPARHLQVPVPSNTHAKALSWQMRFPPLAARGVNEALHTGLGTGVAAASGKGFNCIGCDYSGQNLAGHSFRGQHLTGSDFSGSNLQNADFSNATVQGVDFSRANLRGANFSHAVLTGCDLSHADLTGVNFDGVQMTGCNVAARSLSPSQARALIFTCRSGCDFSGANLSGQNLRGVSLVGVDLSGADLRGADLSNSKLSGVDLDGAKLDGARFTGASIVGCDLSGVDLSRVDLSNAKLAGDKLTDPRR